MNLPGTILVFRQDVKGKAINAQDLTPAARACTLLLMTGKSKEVGLR